MPTGPVPAPRLTTEHETEQKQWPCFEEAQVIEGGQALAVLLREWDGTISAIRLSIDALAD